MYRKFPPRADATQSLRKNRHKEPRFSDFLSVQPPVGTGTDFSERCKMIRIFFFWGFCFLMGCVLNAPIIAQSAQSSQIKNEIKCEKCRNIPDFAAIFQGTDTPSGTNSDLNALKTFLDVYNAMDAAVLEREHWKQTLENTQDAQNAQNIEVIHSQIRILDEKIHALYHQTLDSIGPAWRQDPKNSRVVRYMFSLLAAALDGDQYEAAYTIAREMMSQKLYEDESILYEMAGISAFMMNRFDVARLCFNEALQKETLTRTGNVYNELIPYYTQAWKTELALRRQDSVKGDLPRVAVQTTKGNFEIELFEDSAPNTVANFLTLAEKGFYDNNDFSLVLPGFKAQVGSSSPGYTIADEFGRPDDRKIFRGSVGLFHGDKPNSGGAQFFITLVPVPQMDGKYTVFGRVVKGMDVVSSLERTRETDGGAKSDKILRIRILNRRDHVYAPEKLNK